MVDIDVIADKISGTLLECPHCQVSFKLGAIFYKEVTHCIELTQYHMDSYIHKDRKYLSLGRYSDDEAFYTRESVTTYKCNNCEGVLSAERIEAIIEYVDCQ